MPKKQGFFTKIKKAIFRFEEYENFIEEPLKKVFSYFFKLIAVFSLLVTIALTYTLNTNVSNIKILLENEIPQFKIEKNVLDIEEKDSFEYYFEDYAIQLIMNETLSNYEQNDYINSLSLLKDKAIIKYSGITQEIGYNDIGIISNQTIIDFFETKEWKTIYINVCLVMFVLNFVLYSIIILLDIITLSILGLIVNTFIRTKFKYQDLVKISIYAMTLPIVLYLLYIVANTLLGVTIKFFQFAYNAISYVYLITVMLIMKSDAIKNMQELQNVLEQQKRVKEELKRQAEEEKEKQRQKEKEKEEEKKEKGKTPQEPQTNNG